MELLYTIGNLLTLLWLLYRVDRLEKDLSQAKSIIGLTMKTVGMKKLEAQIKKDSKLVKE